MPRGETVISCLAPFGAGGLGRHLQEVARALQRTGRDPICLCGPCEDPSALPERCRPLPDGGLSALADPLVRFSPGWRAWKVNASFDVRAARAQPPAENLIAFNGQADRQFRVARRAGMASISLMSANSHIRCVERQHARALAQYPLEGSWASHLVARNLREYAQAERIHVSSSYIWESFVQEGVPEERLSLFPLIPDERYTPDPAPAERESFDVVYVGGLSVTKGVPLLIDAFRSLAHADMRLLLVGGWETRGMRLFVQRACAEDERILVSPGRPLEHLRGARLYVHPAYDDGFAYAAAEALACGVPAIVSENTGVKDLIEDSPGSGLIVPTGDLAALTEAIACAYRGEILRG